MLTGELRNQIDGIWNDFWSGGLSNPLQVIEQITYLIFIKRLDEMQELEERKATTLGKPIERRIFPEGFDGRGKPTKEGEPKDSVGPSATAQSVNSPAQRKASACPKLISRQPATTSRSTDTRRSSTRKSCTTPPQPFSLIYGGSRLKSRSV
jgi:hypothetical protein